MDEDEPRGCCIEICDEFDTANFSLAHEPIEDFLISQWQTADISLRWLVYRWVLAAFFISSFTSSIVQFWYGGHWLIYLTSWGFVLCMITCTFGAILVTIYRFDPDKFDDDSKVFYVYWLMHWTALVMAVVITFMYWVFIFPRTGIHPSKALLLTPQGFDNLSRHGFNAIFMLLDHMLVAFPTRLLHLIYPIFAGIVYSIFTWFYYFAGGLDRFGNRYIYSILNWQHPATAIVTVIGTLTVTTIVSVILFGLFKLRVAMYDNSSLSGE